jgi:co-chaperonin GroES (HSP10)
MSTYFEPVNEWLLVQRQAKPAAVKIGEIIVPESSVKAIPQATILAIGKDVTNHIDVQVGDLIVLGPYNGQDEKFGDNLVLTTVRWDEIRLIIRERAEYNEAGGIEAHDDCLIGRESN